MEKNQTKIYIKPRVSLKNIFSYLQGWYRYRLYYSSGPLRFLMREHIHEQIAVRINSMNKECYNSGSCIKCGCATTALQMSNKSCEGLCYPPLVDNSYWKHMRKGARTIHGPKIDTKWFINWVPEIKDGKYTNKMILKFEKF